MTDEELYRRNVASLLASWEAYAGGTVRRGPGVAAAVFPDGPERDFYNNALLERGVADRAAAIAFMEAAYGEAGVGRFAAWVHESDEAMRAEIAGRGYTFSEATRVMGMKLNGSIPAPQAAIEPIDWPTYLAAAEMPEGMLARTDPHAFPALAARVDGEIVATAISFEHAGDCVVGNVETLEHARRRGLATALTARIVSDAQARGCTTASLQATEMAERVYASVGFRDLGRFLEFVP